MLYLTSVSRSGLSFQEAEEGRHWRFIAGTGLDLNG
jgi:hypothetical protein